MNKAVHNAEVIKAWADGKTIQWFNARFKTWVNFDQKFHCGPWSDRIYKWRVKPEPKKGWVRVAEHSDNGVHWVSNWADHEGNSESDIEARIDFIRWLSPRLDFNYPEDHVWHPTVPERHKC